MADHLEMTGFLHVFHIHAVNQGPSIGVRVKVAVTSQYGSISEVNGFPILGVNQLHFLSLLFFKGHFTFPTENMNFFGGPDDGSATGANILAGT